MPKSTLPLDQHGRMLSAFKALEALIAAINQSLDFDAIINDALDEIMELFRCRSTHIRLIDFTTNELVVTAHRGYSAEDLAHLTMRRKYGEGLSAVSIESGEVFIIEDINTDPRYGTRDGFARRIGVRSFIYCLLSAKGKVLGDIVVHYDTPHTYSPEEIQLFMAIGHLIGAAIENARSYGEKLGEIAERKRAEEALRKSEERYRELSTIDGLTQLYNSRHFYDQLKMEINRVDRYEQPLTLLLFDLDNFKAFNDAFGHIEGDQVLMRLGQVVKRCLRQTDSAYRYGGEEFTVILPMTTSEDGILTAERIRAEFKNESFSPVPSKDVHMTMSIGLAQYKTQEDMKAFVHRVDQLMYQAKKNGKDRVYSESYSQEQFKW